MDILDRMPFKAQKAVFDKLLDVADLSRLDPKERAQYDSNLMAYRDWVNTLRFAVKNAEAKGKQEEKCAVAFNMKKDKIDIPTISRYTGLSAEEIEAL